MRLCLCVCVCVARAGACAQVSTPAEPAQATLLGAATIQEDIKQAHGHGLRGISRGTSAEELRFCSWKSWFRSHTLTHSLSHIIDCVCV